MGGTTAESNGQPKLKSDTDIFEVIIFTLSPVLGGRDQVLATPFIEAVKYIEMERSRKKSDRWNEFLDRLYSNTIGVDGEKRQKYIEAIQPEQARKQLEMKTNISQLEELKNKQNTK